MKWQIFIKSFKKYEKSIKYYTSFIQTRSKSLYMQMFYIEEEEVMKELVMKKI